MKQVYLLLAFLIGTYALSVTEVAKLRHDDDEDGENMDAPGQEDQDADDDQSFANVDSEETDSDSNDDDDDDDNQGDDQGDNKSTPAPSQAKPATLVSEESMPTESVTHNKNKNAENFEIITAGGQEDNLDMSAVENDDEVRQQSAEEDAAVQRVKAQIRGDAKEAPAPKSMLQLMNFALSRIPGGPHMDTLPSKPGNYVSLINPGENFEQMGRRSLNQMDVVDMSDPNPAEEQDYDRINLEEQNDEMAQEIAGDFLQRRHKSHHKAQTAFEHSSLKEIANMLIEAFPAEKMTSDQVYNQHLAEVKADVKEREMLMQQADQEKEDARKVDQEEQIGELEEQRAFDAERQEIADDRELVDEEMTKFNIDMSNTEGFVLGDEAGLQEKDREFNPEEPSDMLRNE